MRPYPNKRTLCTRFFFFAYPLSIAATKPSVHSLVTMEYNIQVILDWLQVSGLFYVVGYQGINVQFP